MNPQEIVRKEFREAFRGYHQADVDLFLDEVVDEMTRLVDDNQKMRVRLAALQQELARYRDARSTRAQEQMASRYGADEAAAPARRPVPPMPKARDPFAPSSSPPGRAGESPAARPADPQVTRPAEPPVEQRPASSADATQPHQPIETREPRPGSVRGDRPFWGGD